MHTAFIISAAIFCFLAWKLVAKTNRSGKRWLHGFVVVVGLIPGAIFIYYNSKPDPDTMAFVLVASASIGTMIALFIETYI